MPVLNAYYNSTPTGWLQAGTFQGVYGGLGTKLHWFLRAEPSPRVGEYCGAAPPQYSNLLWEVPATGRRYVVVVARFAMATSARAAETVRAITAELGEPVAQWFYHIWQTDEPPGEWSKADAWSNWGEGGMGGILSVIDTEDCEYAEEEQPVKPAGDTSQ
jgi:hypothetical protein